MKNVTFQWRMICTLTILWVSISVYGQSEFVSKGASGIESGYIFVNLPGDNFHGGNLSSSINGTVDFGLQFGVIAEQLVATPSAGVHAGGEAGQVGIAIHLSYAVLPMVENYFGFSPTIYYHGRLTNGSIIPSYTLAVPLKMEEVAITSTFGLNFKFGNRTAFILRPTVSIVEGDVYFGIGIGLLFIQ